MAKGWKFIGSNELTTIQSKQHMKQMDKAIRHMPIFSEKVLIQEGEKSYKEAQQYKAELLAAYEDKKLKSKALVKEAKRLKRNKFARVP